MKKSENLPLIVDKPATLTSLTLSLQLQVFPAKSKISNLALNCSKTVVDVTKDPFEGSVV